MQKNKVTYSKIIDTFLSKKKNIKKVKVLIDGKSEYKFSKVCPSDKPNSVLNLIYNNNKAFDNIFTHLKKVCSDNGETLEDKYKNRNDEVFLDAFEKYADEVLDYLYDPILNILLGNAIIDKETKYIATLIFEDQGFMVKESSFEEDCNGIDLHIYKGEESKKLQIKSSRVNKSGIDKILLSGFQGGIHKLETVDILLVLERRFDTVTRKNQYYNAYIIETKNIEGVSYEESHWVVTTPYSLIKCKTENDLKNLKKNSDYKKKSDKGASLF